MLPDVVEVTLGDTDAPLSTDTHVSGMSDKDLLGLVLGSVAVLMFATGIILAV
jgi:hypothetical protein